MKIRLAKRLAKERVQREQCAGGIAAAAAEATLGRDIFFEMNANAGFAFGPSQ